MDVFAGEYSGLLSVLYAASLGVPLFEVLLMVANFTLAQSENSETHTRKSEALKDGSSAAKGTDADQPWYVRFLHRLQDEASTGLTALNTADTSHLHPVEISPAQAHAKAGEQPQAKESPKTADAKPADAKPANAKPANAKPADSKPTDGKPPAGKSGDGKPDGKPAEKKNDSTASGTVLGALGDAASWLAETSLGKAVIGEVKQIKNTYIDPIADWLGDEWTQFASLSQSEVKKPAAAKDETILNELMEKEHFEARNGKNGMVEKKAEQAKQKYDENTDVGKAAPLTDAQGGKIKLGADAKDTGKTVKMGNEELKIFSSGKDTYLVDKNGDVVAQKKADGTFEFIMKDKDGKPDGKMSVRLELNRDGKYEVKHLERFDSNGRLLSKMQDGALLNYTYDKDGKLLVIGGMLDLRDQNLTPQQLTERLRNLQRLLGEHGFAIVRAKNEHGEPLRLHVQNLDKETQVITDMDRRSAQIEYKGLHYIVDQNGELGVLGNDGKWHALTDEQRKAANDIIRQKILEQLRIAERRAKGDATAQLNGIRLLLKPNGDRECVVVDPHSGEPAVTVVVPKEDHKPMVLIDHTRGDERTEMSGPGKAKIEKADGTPILTVDPDKGVITPHFTIDKNGLTDNTTGNRLGTNGNVYDPDGRVLFDSKQFAEQMLGPGELTAKQLAALAEATAKSGTASAYASQAFSLMFSPGSLNLCKSLCLDALGILGSVEPNCYLAQLVTVSARAEVFDALSAVSIGSKTFDALSTNGLADSGLDTGKLIRMAALSSNTSPVSIMEAYKDQRIGQTGAA